MTTHTQGPYRVIDNLKELDCIGIYAADGTLIAEIRDPESTKEPERSQEIARMRSNARLLACAPELVEALELALVTIKRLTIDHHGFNSTQGTQDILLSVLNKVKGV